MPHRWPMHHMLDTCCMGALAYVCVHHVRSGANHAFDDSNLMAGCHSTANTMKTFACTQMSTCRCWTVRCRLNVHHVARVPRGHPASYLMHRPQRPYKLPKRGQYHSLCLLHLWHGPWGSHGYAACGCNACNIATMLALGSVRLKRQCFPIWRTLFRSFYEPCKR